MNTNKILIAAIAIILILQVIQLVKGGGKLGGSTSDDWNVGGNLAVTGTSALTGAVTLSGTITATGGSTTLATTTVESLITGGGVMSTTTFTAGTLTASDIISNNFIDATVNKATALTLPATTTLYSYLTTNGDAKSFYIFNGTTTAAIGEGKITITAGIGIELKGTSTDSVLISSQELKKLDCVRRSNTTTTCSISGFRDSD